MRRRLGTLLAAALLLLAPGWKTAGGTASLADLSGHWSEELVREAIGQGWVDGYPDGRFRPEATLTRAAFVKMLVAALQRSPAPHAATPFADSADHWVQTQGWLSAAVDSWLILPGEYPEGRFEPDQPITREEIAVMVARAMGKDAESRLRDGYNLPLQDVNAITVDKGYIEVAYSDGVLTGFPDGTFRPRDRATRAQAVAMVARMLVAPHRVTATLSVGPWELERLEPICGTPDTRPLRVWAIQAQGAVGARLPVNNGTFQVFVHSNTSICGGAGSAIRMTAEEWALRLVPYGEGQPTPFLPVVQVKLPPLPVLQAGEQAALTVTVDGSLPPGWYLAEPRGRLQGEDERGSLIAPELPGYWQAPRGAARGVLVTDALPVGGTASGTSRPVPVVGGVPMPLESAFWGGPGLERPVVRLQVPWTCGPDTDRVVELDQVQIVALGDGFGSLVPGGMGDDGLTAWQVPGETSSLLIRAKAVVRACTGALPGDLIAMDDVAWQIDLK